MLNMGGSCSVKNKTNMEFYPVNETITLSLYRGIFKTLKELDWDWEPQVEKEGFMQ